MLRDTLTLAGATLLPLLVLVFVMVETLHPGEAVYNNSMGSTLREKRLPGGQTLQIVEGDITFETVDAIVNAANNQLEHGGGVAAAISRAGGPKIQVESGVWVREHGAVSHAEPAYTTAGNLPCRYVIHAVGPVWGDGDEDHKLAAAVRGSLWRADELKLTSIALPAISTGIFGFPKERAAKIIFAAIETYFSAQGSSTVKLVRVTLFDSPTINVFLEVWDS
jgi:O-acetyl-ADP-ribose deacetylase (regulator of RNase III)